MAQRVVFLDRDSVKAHVRRPACAGAYVEYPSTPVDKIVERLDGATVAIINKTPMRGPTLAQLPALRMIAIAATGYDVVDVPYCREHGIAVANVRDYAVHTVPEHVFALVLALRRNLLAYRSDIERGAWQRAEQFCFLTHPMADLHGSTLGIVGAGAIGQAVAAIGRGFGMRVMFAEHASRRSQPVPGAPLDAVIEQADVLTLHCPLTPATRNLITLERLRRMKRTALLINTSRGGLVDEAALLTALDEGLIAGAGFDVLTSEPPRDGHPLLDVRRDNFILTPHVAWASNEAMQGLADQLVDNIEAWDAGRTQNRVV